MQNFTKGTDRGCQGQPPDHTPASPVLPVLPSEKQPMKIIRFMPIGVSLYLDRHRAGTHSP